MLKPKTWTLLALKSPLFSSSTSNYKILASLKYCLNPSTFLHPFHPYLQILPFHSWTRAASSYLVFFLQSGLPFQSFTTVQPGPTMSLQANSEGSHDVTIAELCSFTCSQLLTLLQPHWVLRVPWSPGVTHIQLSAQAVRSAGPACHWANSTSESQIKNDPLGSSPWPQV